MNLEPLIPWGALLLFVAFVVFLFSTIGSSSSRPPGHTDGFSCAGKGCEQVKSGEFADLHECQKTCKSYVKRNGNCKIASGVPWDSYATLNLCRRS